MDTYFYPHFLKIKKTRGKVETEMDCMKFFFLLLQFQKNGGKKRTVRGAMLCHDNATEVKKKNSLR